MNTAELGCAKSAKVKITLTEEKPFFYRPYRLTASEQSTVKTIINNFFKTGIARESDSEYCSPVLLVKKSNGESRLCIDYRKLN